MIFVGIFAFFAEGKEGAKRRMKEEKERRIGR